MGKENYVVYTEFFNSGNIERWYYGIYTRERANEVASELNDFSELGSLTSHCVCSLEDAKELNILNMPR